jgi:starch synthase
LAFKNKLSKIPTILTIHNAQYQGWMGWDKSIYIPAYDTWKQGQLDWNGTINPLASGIKCAWKVTTVSHSYMAELSYNSNGLEKLFEYEKGKCYGILNGIDNDVWNPKTDTYIQHHFTFKSVTKGKQKNKAAICEQFRLNPELPLFVFIGRLVGEKGADLLPEICSVALNNNLQEINILILGSGESNVENNLQSMQHFYNGNFNSYIGYNEKLAHNIYAGADFLLMPSRVEPCGLNQMYAMRYGTIPIVRRTGGLRDTVLDIGDGGFGICHDNTSVYDVNYSITRAIDLFNDKEKYDSVRHIAMQIDHSWDKIAKEYITVYQSLKN